MAQLVPVPQHVTALGVLDPVDYQDAVAASTERHHSPQEWAQRIFASTSPVMRRCLRGVFRLLRRGRGPSPTEHALPGELIHSGPEEAVIGIDLAVGLTARVIVTSPPGQVVMTTLVRTNSRRARAVWAVLAPVHRATARHMLDRAATDPVAHPTDPATQPIDESTSRS